MRDELRYRLNRWNGSTALGLLVARAGRATVRRGPRRLWLAEGHVLPVRPVFTIGDVVLSRRAGVDARPARLAHEARHAEQYAWFGGLPMLPLYAIAAALSWAVAGDRATANPFERAAGLADGGYGARQGRRARRPLWPFRSP